MHKFCLYAVCALIFATNVNAASYEYALQQCRRMAELNPPEISVTYNYGTLKFDTSKNAQELAALHAKANDEPTTHKIKGLTQLSPHINVATQISPKHLNDGRYCLYAEKINIKLWYEPKVYLLNTLKPGSCRFNITLRHEQTHLDLGHYALYLLARAIKAQMPYIVNGIGPRVVSAADNEDEANLINEEYIRQVGSLFDVFKNTMKQYNNKIDNDENYLAESRLCL